ncbi:MAG: hypothetical protein P8Y37_04500 [Anaerolineales bacterium]
MRTKNIELWGSALVIALIGAVYLSIVFYAEMPAASSLFGHGLGILGFIMMLMTETLYSIRKRYQFARWGKLQNWLSFHIFTGLVGPFLVFLHTSWKFQGLAGVLTLMTLIIVASGFIGRYFYTALPRSVEGTALETAQVLELIKSNQLQIKSWLNKNFPERSTDGLFDSPDQKILPSTKKELHKLAQTSQDPESTEHIQEIIAVNAKLHSQLSHLDRTRKLLAIWHTVHVPLGLSLFLVAFVHIFAALYYSTLLH